MTAAHGGATNALPVITTPVEMIGCATVTNNYPLLGLGNSGGSHRQGGTMTTTNAPITANNCVGSTPAVPDRTG